jgi:hypothetical protein
VVTVGGVLEVEVLSEDLEGFNQVIHGSPLLYTDSTTYASTVS